MSFNTSNDLLSYGETKYGVIAGVVFEQLCNPINRHYVWNALAKGLGSGSNGVMVSVGRDISDDYEDYDTPIEAYGFVRFSMSWEDDMEERMPYFEFIEYLKDAHRVYSQMCPEEEAKSKADLDRAIAEITKLQKAHEKWKRRNKPLTS